MTTTNHLSSFRIFLIISIFIGISDLSGQNLEVDGKVKISDMDLITTGQKIVLRDQEGILAERDVTSIMVGYFLNLPNGLQVLVDAGESAENLLNEGASASDLLIAGISVGELLNAGVTATELVSAGAKVDSLISAGITPIDIFNAGVVIDSLYGKVYEGGLIFYMNTSTGAGLIAADADQSGGVFWGANMATGATDQSIGSGQSNTTTIVTAYGGGSYAARICDELVLNDKSDWFLPSRQELNEMYLNLRLNGFGNFNNLYWSSSEQDGTTAWRQDFTNGNQDTRSKSENNKRVRAVRAF